MRGSVMQPSLNTAHRQEQAWTYASITVLEGERRLKPAQVAFDRLLFTEPPRLTSGQIEIILVNGDAEQRHFAIVLPHDAGAIRIPIRLLAMESNISNSATV